MCKTNACWVSFTGARFHDLASFYFSTKYIQLFRERLSEKMCTRQSRKVIWDMISTRFLTTVAVEPTFVAFLWHSQTHLHSLSYQFFQLSLKKKENSKPPTMPFKIVACTFPDNLSRNSCIWLVFPPRPDVSRAQDIQRIYLN